MTSPDQQHGNQKYDWDLWLVPPGCILVKGLHYQVSQSTMSQTIRNQASKRNLSVGVEDRGDRLVVTVSKMEEHADA